MFGNSRLKQALSLSTAVVLALGLSACGSYVKRSEFDAAVGDLRATDDNLRGQLQSLQLQFSEMTGDLETRFANYDAQITSLQGRLRVDMTAHFAYDDASLREDDKPALLDFSEVVREFHPNILITVEGFTDAAGSAEYNQWLGQQRADAVRKFLISQGGLEASRVRAVSYGEDNNRQVEQGAWGETGQANRRVALVVDYIAG